MCCITRHVVIETTIEGHKKLVHQSEQHLDCPLAQSHSPSSASATQKSIHLKEEQGWDEQQRLGSTLPGSYIAGSGFVLIFPFFNGDLITFALSRSLTIMPSECPATAFCQKASTAAQLSSLPQLSIWLSRAIATLLGITGGKWLHRRSQRQQN